MCDGHTVGAVITHLAEEEQGRASDWNHMQGRQVTSVVTLSQQPEARWQISVALIADRRDTLRDAFRASSV